MRNNIHGTPTNIKPKYTPICNAAKIRLLYEMAKLFDDFLFEFAVWRSVGFAQSLTLLCRKSPDRINYRGFLKIQG